jgi:hypothetical protein
VCGARIQKFDRRLQVVETKPESWGDGHGTAVVHTLAAAVVCGWACMEAFAAERAREAVAV